MKLDAVEAIVNRNKSPPSRGAWIEIVVNAVNDVMNGVAPLAGGVD